MVMSKKVKFYSPQFKTQAVQLAAQLNSANQAAIDLGVAPASVNRWVSQAKSHAEQGKPAFTGRGVVALTDSEKRIRDLEREVAILRQEREILKAAAKFFAKENK
jgi:transposase